MYTIPIPKVFHSKEFLFFKFFILTHTYYRIYIALYIVGLYSLKYVASSPVCQKFYADHWSTCFLWSGETSKLLNFHCCSVPFSIVISCLDATNKTELLVESLIGTFQDPSEHHRLTWDVLFTNQIDYRYLEWLKNFFHRNHRFWSCWFMKQHSGIHCHHSVPMKTLY